jgi:hypothetical protein
MSTMQDLYGNPIGAAKDFPLTIYRKRQAAILYHYASLDYLKGLIPLIDETIFAFHRVAQTAQAQGRDALFTSKRWGVRGTSANADTYGTPFLSEFSQSVLKEISDRAFEVYDRTTGAQYAAGGLREVDTGWMSDEEFNRYETAWNEAFAYASKIDRTMSRQTDWEDSGFVQEWFNLHEHFEPVPMFRVRTDVQAETGKKPPRTGVYVPQDDPHGALQFAWTGGDYGALGECSTFNDIGLDALSLVGRAALWLNDPVNDQKMFDFVKRGPHTKVFRADPNFDDRNPSVDNAWAWAASEAFTTRSCKWYFVELVNGEFDDAPETDADLIGSPSRLRCEAGQPCPVTGEWSTPAVTGSRHFKQGETLPDLNSDYGQTIWYLEQRAT